MYRQLKGGTWQDVSRRGRISVTPKTTQVDCTNQVRAAGYRQNWSSDALDVEVETVSLTRTKAQPKEADLMELVDSIYPKIE